MYTLAHSLQIYLDKEYGDVGNINITKLNEIILNEISFVGASGLIVFDENGDRSEDGLYAFGNSLNINGDVEYFGYFYEDNEELKLSVDYDKIIWPQYFIDRDMIPRSGQLTKEQIVDISKSVYIPMYTLSVLSMCITLIYVALTWKYHNTAVLRAASWKINLIMCAGGLCGYVSMIIYGIDEHSLSAGPGFTFLCNLRLWTWIMSYTLLFMPLFAKTYRLSRIFSEILEKKHIYDKDLMYGILICLIVDLILLTLYTAIEPLQRMYISGSYQQIDELQRVHFIYGSCETTNNSQYIFYALIALWKTIESLFGIYCALSVSRAGFGHKSLTQFDETTQQLLAILFLIVALCIALPVGALGPSDNPSYFYAVVGFLTISVGNVTMTLNLFPRLYALMKGNAEQKYSQSPEQKTERLIIEQLRKIGVDEKWWKKASNVMDSDEVFRSHANKDHHHRQIARNNSNTSTNANMDRQITIISGSADIELPVVMDQDEEEETVVMELNKKISVSPTSPGIAEEIQKQTEAK